MNIQDHHKFVNIKYYYYKGKDLGNFIPIKIIKNESELKSKKEVGVEIFELKTGWKVPSWGDEIDVYSTCTQYDKKGVKTVNPLLYRYNRLKCYLKTWDLHGRISDVSPSEIDSLQHNCAHELMEGFDQVVDFSSVEMRAFAREVRAFFEGKWIWSYQPDPIIYEYLIAKDTGWTREYIRSLPAKVFNKLLQTIIVSDGVDKEFEAELATGQRAKQMF
jgi:hypothetical protein